PKPSLSTPLLLSGDRTTWLQTLQPYYQFGSLAPAAGNHGASEDGIKGGGTRGTAEDSAAESEKKKKKKKAAMGKDADAAEAAAEETGTTSKGATTNLKDQGDGGAQEFNELMKAAISGNNPTIAHASMLHLLTTPQSTDFLSSLVSMDMSLPSMEVVNRLTLSVPLPQEFVHLYIANCITSCTSITD
ncbi:hypothetical protein TrRE_jg1237, partial [Triparma retinervis]